MHKDKELESDERLKKLIERVESFDGQGKPGIC